MNPRPRSLTCRLAVLATLIVALAVQPLAAGRAEAGEVHVGVEAHAGGAGVAPADSLKAFAAAIAAGADVIELDVQFTRDHVAVVNHEDRVADVTAARAAKDGVLPRYCDHDGAVLHLMTYAQVQGIRCAGQALPTLAQVIELVKPSKATINLEIKTFDDVAGGTKLVQSKASRRDYAKRAVTQMVAGGMRGRFFVSSFAWRDILPTVKGLDPRLDFLAIERWANLRQDGGALGYRAIRDAHAKGADAFAMDVRLAQVGYLDLIKALGMYPMLFHIATDAQARFAIASGVHLLSANDPAEARALISSLAGEMPTRSITTRSIRAKTVLGTTLPAGATRNVRIIHGAGLVPASAQQQLAGIRLQVTITAKGTGVADLAPRNGHVGVDGVRLAIAKGSTTTTVLVSPGDHGELTVSVTAKAKVTVKVTGWTTSTY